MSEIIREDTVAQTTETPGRSVPEPIDSDQTSLTPDGLAILSHQQFVESFRNLLETLQNKKVQAEIDQLRREVEAMDVAIKAWQEALEQAQTISHIPTRKIMVGIHETNVYDRADRIEALSAQIPPDRLAA